MQQLEGFDSGFDADFDALIHIVNEMKQTEADKLAPAKFSYIANLVSKAIDQPKGVRALLVERIEKALADYPETFERKQTAAQSIHSSDNKVSLQTVLSLLNDEQRSLESMTRPESLDPNQLSFDELLRQQDQAIAKATKPHVLPSKTSNKNKKSPVQQSEFAELKSVRLHKELQVKYQLEQLIHLTKEESPENPGPLNPQMLTIKALTLADEISPAYLKRLLTYLDTLFYLEIAGASMDKKLSKL